MKVLIQFMKPYKWLFLLIIVVMSLDVAGALLIPTITADMINAGIAGQGLD